MNELEKNIGYIFKNKKYLKTALTHSSYANEHRCRSYERQEFLGDSVLSIIVSDYLFEHMKSVNEGDLSRTRAALVCEDTLAELAHRINLGDFLLLGNGEEKSGSRERASILADVFEAVLAAIYLDSSIENARKFVLDIMKDKLDDAVHNKTGKDYKSTLQESVQHRFHGKTKIVYTTAKETGPEHCKEFYVDLTINGVLAASGKGRTKKEAEQEAARIALSEKKYEML
ncbi:MAG: ribonuclease III [Clostridia bacterium]|nr:ribonuclease III [Clostridia bacterium]